MPPSIKKKTCSSPVPSGLLIRRSISFKDRLFKGPIHVHVLSLPDCDPNIVELYIGYLRKKVDAGREPMISTVRGVGYMLKATE